MRSGKWWLLWLWLMARSLSAQADELILVWDFPADYTPAPASFLITLLSTNAPEQPAQFRVPHHGPASCAGSLPKAALTSDSVCGRPPDCLAPGIYRMEVQAEWSDGRLSESSNIATCQALAGCGYDCASVAVPAPLQALLTTAATGEVTVDTAEVERTVQALAQAHPPVPPPSVTAAAATAAQVVDTVQPALQALAARTST